MVFSWLKYLEFNKIDNFYSLEAKTPVFLSELRIYILFLHKKSENQVFSNTFIIFSRFI
jgi:hypothetical protein